MKKIFLSVIFLAVLMAGCKQNTNSPEVVTVENNEVVTEQKAEKPEILAENVEEKTFTVEGMTCAVGCAAAIQKKLNATAGVKSATVDFDTKTADVEYDKTQLTPQKIKEIVEAVGDGKSYTTVGL